MTKTIINCIDVSECKLYDYGICDSEMAEDLNCEQNPNCYFKQFKRLQEENKRLQMLSCANCGEKLEFAKKVCSSCGEELKSNAKFCANCGQKVNK
jgi:rRNA maturation endonuclease Nob1